MIRSALTYTFVVLVLALSACGSKEQAKTDSSPAVATQQTDEPTAEATTEQPVAIDGGPVKATFDLQIKDSDGYSAEAIFKVHKTRESSSAADAADFCQGAISNIVGQDSRLRMIRVDVETIPKDSGDFEWPEGSVIGVSTNEKNFGAQQFGGFRVACGDGTSPAVSEGNAIYPPVGTSPTTFSFEIITGTKASPNAPNGHFDLLDSTELEIGGINQVVSVDSCAKSGGSHKQRTTTTQPCLFVLG